VNSGKASTAEAVRCDNIVTDILSNIDIGVSSANDKREASLLYANALEVELVQKDGISRLPPSIYGRTQKLHDNGEIKQR